MDGRTRTQPVPASILQYHSSFCCPLERLHLGILLSADRILAIFGPLGIWINRSRVMQPVSTQPTTAAEMHLDARHSISGIRRRHRAVQSCYSCRLRKVKCDKQRPCRTWSVRERKYSSFPYRSPACEDYRLTSREVKPLAVTVT